MKKRINAKFILISTIAVMATGLSAMFIFYDILKEQIFEDLEANAYLLSAINPKLLAEEISTGLRNDGLRITMIDEDGKVLYDSVENENEMENHADREEVVQAEKAGEGRALRVSATSNLHTFYYAMQTEGGMILRIAKASDSIYTLIAHMIRILIGICIAVLLLCLFWAKSLTKKLIAPIEKMAENIMMIDEADVYEEMRPFVATIKAQHTDILQNSKIRQEFTANVSHELKTPLTAISGYAELIASGITSGEDTVRFASEIQRSAERLQHLINDIIKLSELDEQDLRFEFEEIDLGEIAKLCAANMQMNAQKNGVNITISGTSAKINGNKMLIEELFYNLCSNAIRYNFYGGNITIITEMEDGHAILIVSDTGIGIPKESQERIFERFYRVDKSRSKLTGGTGLGLAIVKHIVAQHEAQIFLSSEENVGTEVKVIF